MQKRFNDLLIIQMKIRKCLDDIKEQQGARYYKKIEEEFQVPIRGWMPKNKGDDTFLALLSYISEENISLDVKEQSYQALDTYLQKKFKTELQEVIPQQP